MTEDHSDRIVTERLVLRTPGIEDAASVAALMSPDVSRWLASWPPGIDLDEAARRIADARAEVQAGRALHWVIEHKQSSQALGWIRTTRSAADPARGELGFWLGTSFQGCGYATEAVRAAVPAGFERLGLVAIEGGAQPGNEASLRLMKRVGMVPSGERQVWASARQQHELCVYYETRRA